MNAQFMLMSAYDGCHVRLDLSAMFVHQGWGTSRCHLTQTQSTILQCACAWSDDDMHAHFLNRLLQALMVNNYVIPSNSMHAPHDINCIIVGKRLGL